MCVCVFMLLVEIKQSGEEEKDNENWYKNLEVKILRCNWKKLWFLKNKIKISNFKLHFEAFMAKLT